ncbi:hypothetical protein RF11_03596 [Thelohanellus kitauei]|uniref:Uncharacterized protein n=1 Tax=Thelohanellus kitauei TaxID=669202 RepID=A0A0C2IN80_THEKT|nr:hypothetical protein RF11_03596 [Thelohanellus kitauei]
MDKKENIYALDDEENKRKKRLIFQKPNIAYCPWHNQVHPIVHRIILSKRSVARTCSGPFWSTTFSYNGYRFVITERPIEGNLGEYLEALHKHDIKYLARCSDAGYVHEVFEKIGMEILVQYFSLSNDLIK